MEGARALEPSAAHPPLYSLYLSVYSWLGFDTPLAHRLASCLLGVAAVVVIGLVARRIAGDRAGLVAAGIAAVYPQLWINDGMLISESMYVLVIAVTLLLTYRLWESRRWTDAAWLGAVIGLSALTRPEAVILVPLLGVPFLFSRREPFARRLGTLCIIGGLCLVVILPWWVRNLTQFHDPTFLATGNGVVLQVSNCDGTYSGQFLGYCDIKCLTGDAPPTNAQQEQILHGTSVPGLAYLHAHDPRDDSQLDTTAREKAFDYIGDHLSRLPVVVAARVGRIWGVFRPGQDVNFDIFVERRGQVAVVDRCVHVLRAPAVRGRTRSSIMRKRRVPISPMIAIFAMVTITVAIGDGHHALPRRRRRRARHPRRGRGRRRLIRHFRRTGRRVPSPTDDGRPARLTAARQRAQHRAARRRAPEPRATSTTPTSTGSTTRTRYGPAIQRAGRRRRRPRRALRADPAALPRARRRRCRPPSRSTRSSAAARSARAASSSSGARSTPRPAPRAGSSPPASATRSRSARS